MHPLRHARRKFWNEVCASSLDVILCVGAVLVGRTYLVWLLRSSGHPNWGIDQIDNEDVFWAFIHAPRPASLSFGVGM